MTTKSLAEIYDIRGRFRRSARIDSDLGERNPLAGYSFNDSTWEVLRQIFVQIGTSQQRAFTWTGPYGAGKSSLALLLASLLGPDRKRRDLANGIVGSKRRSILFDHFDAPNKGWLVIPVVGAQSEIEPLIRDAFDAAVKQKWPTRKPTGLKEASRKEGTRALINGLLVAAQAATKTGDGLLLIIDEMGKTLEGIADEGGDIQFFQDLAEAFQRADANCFMVGILHQAFQEYAARVGRVAQSEWAKVQGRYADIPFSVSQEDVIALVGEAMEGPKPNQDVLRLCRSVLARLDHPRYKGLKGFDKKLAACWPLHPMAALMLGPLSRSRFGQNERSTFSFLMSSEPEGFRSFLLETDAGRGFCYQPHRLWDYLQLNLEPVILASPEGHRWSEAADAIDRSAKLDDPLVVSIAKLIGLLDLFGRQFGLVASKDVIADSFPDQSKRKVGSALNKLQEASIAVFRKHLNAWALFAGSDVDLEAAIEGAYSRLGDSIASLRPYLPPAGPVVAKRHYHETGTLRWFDVRVLTAREVTTGMESLTKDKGQSGSFILVVADEDAKKDALGKACKKAASTAGHEGYALAFGTASKDNQLIDALREMAALQRVASTTPELEGDAVARRELNGRLNAARSRLRDVLDDTVEGADWHLPGGGSPQRSGGTLSRLASDICDTIYFKAPTVHNELVNRDKPSSNAVAARRNLLHRMVDGAEAESLGIEGYPAEIGLYKGILKASGLHSSIDKKASSWRFGAPIPEAERGSSFIELWNDFTEFLALSEAERQSFEDLYVRWRKAPFGLRHGVMPIFAMALLLARQEEIAVYVNGLFTPTIDDLVIDRLLQAPDKVSLQRFRIEGVRQDVLKRVAGVVANAFTTECPSTPLAVAKPLAKFAYRLPTWVKRTKRIDAETQAIRDALLNANDPNVLLFIDLPRACGLVEDIGEKTQADVIGQVTRQLRRAIQDLGSAYGRMLASLADALADAFGFDDLSGARLEELAERADKVAGFSGDFRLDAFARRLAAKDQARDTWLEGIGGLTANKPVRDWTDPDLDRAKVEIVALAKRFQRIERIVIAQKKEPASLHLNGVVGKGAVTKEIDFALHLDKRNKTEINEVVKALINLLDERGIDNRLRLAAVTYLVHSMSEDVSDEDATVPSDVVETVQ